MFLKLWNPTGLWGHKPLIPACGRQRQVNVFEFEASLVYFIKKKLRDHVWKSREVL